MTKAVVIGAAVALLTFNTIMPASGQTASTSRPDWSGFYVGGEVGGGFGTSRKDFSNGTTTGNFTVSGVLGGATVGYGRQWGNIVAGLEGDFSASGIGGNASCPNPVAVCGTNTNWRATVRPRIGYALGSFLPYATAGLAVGDVNVRSFFNVPGGIGVNYTQTQVGWTAGAGVETAIAPNLSFKVEYLYVQLGDANVPSDAPGITTSTKFNENIIRFGVNYTFK